MNIEPRYHLHAEQSVIGGLLIDNQKWDSIVDIINASDFYNMQHRLLFKSIIDLLTKDIPVDWLTLADYMRANKTYEMAGGDIYVVDLMKNTPIVANITHYAKLVKQAAEDRALMDCAINILNSIEEQTEERIDKAQQMVLNIAEDKAVEPELPTDYMPQVYADLIDRSHGESPNQGLSTGFTALDEITYGFKPGEVIILAARPAMGKTLLAMNIAQNVAFAGKSVFMVSLEMTKAALGKRLLTTVAKLPAAKINAGNLTDTEIEMTQAAYAQICDKTLIIDDLSQQSVMDIRAKARRIKRKHGLDLIMIDYLQLVKATEGENETIKLGYISRGLKALAKDLGVPVLALCQLNRDIERRQNRKPMMSDLRQSGQIEQDADVIMFIDRPETYDDSAEKGLANIHVVKNRDGQIGDLHLKFLGDFCRFENYTGTPRSFEERPYKPQRKEFQYDDF